jgi:hypothetical protein
MFSPLEAEVMTHVTEDLCTLEEIRDRLELGDVAPRSQTDRAIEWLIRHGLIEPGPGSVSAIYRPTALGQVEFTRYRARSSWLTLIAGEC